MNFKKLSNNKYYCYVIGEAGNPAIKIKER